MEIEARSQAHAEWARERSRRRRKWFQVGLLVGSIFAVGEFCLYLDTPRASLYLGCVLSFIVGSLFLQLWDIWLWVSLGG